MNRKMKKLILLITIITFASSVKAYDFEVGGFYYNILSLSELTAEVTCSGEEDEYNNNTATYSGDIVIPKTVEYAGRTFAVTEIHPLAFINCQIGTLTIHENIKNVYTTKDDSSTGGLAGQFKHLIIEDGDNPIGCFRGLIGSDITESVYLGRNIDGEQSTNIVYRGGSFKKITFGEKVTLLGDVCSNCPNLSNVTIPANVKSLSGSFTECENLKTVSAPGVEVLYNAFSGSAIETIDMPNLRSVIGAFAGCQSIKTIVLPVGAVKIGDSAFKYCSNLESIVFPSTLSDFGVDDYGQENFVSCTSLKDIIVCNPTPIAISESNFDSMTFLNATLRVPKGSMDAYKNAPVWKNFFNIIEDENIQSEIFTINNIEDDNYGGEVSLILSEEAMPAYETYMFAKAGAELTVNVKPERSYKLSKLVVNNIDVTTEVKDNQYKTIVNGGICIDAVRFEYDYGYVEPEPAMLTIKHADNGCVKLRVSYYDSYNFVIQPEEGWKLHAVTFNGTDITSYVGENGEIELDDIEEDAILSITFETNSSSVKGTDSNRVKVYGLDDCVVIQGSRAGESIHVYEESGALLKTIKSSGNILRIPLQDGVYVIKLEDKAVKIAI